MHRRAIQEAIISEKTGGGQSGGVDIAAAVGSVGGDIVGRDKIEKRYTVVIENLFYEHARKEPVVVEDGGEAPPPNPYPGLAYFGPDEADCFFGRDAAITRLTEAVNRQSLTALVGASGSGKSSVVLAGLAPRLHAVVNWRFSHFRIGTELDRDPLRGAGPRPGAVLRGNR
jgi:ABC-type multidrug transport system fused ATPase/permease subunit